LAEQAYFVKKELAPDETFELALKKLSEANPAVRRRMKKKGFKRGSR
jgi:predicted nucleotidyltransferase